MILQKVSSVREFDAALQMLIFGNRGSGGIFLPWGFRLRRIKKRASGIPSVGFELCKGVRFRSSEAGGWGLRRCWNKTAER